MSIAVREARPEDLPGLGALLAQLDRLHAAAQPGFFREPSSPPRRLSELTHLLRDRGAGQPVNLLLAEEDGEALGMAVARVHSTPDSPILVPTLRALIDDVVVDEGARGRGVGRRLMEEAARWCAGKGARQLLLTVWRGNEGARRFYEELGFREVSRALCLDLPG